ncbi:LysR family transcriptional regulator [Paraglaciecola arctica]|uniref:LysR family transcriptional regulator n=1 Tax=Paraglaciecola arctica TaxID=1128911 RepID=UPI001C074BEE|nr:LysR family transcriptional regulator [Paraglaciecola arctica]MBU3005022.1 LysR family transcriptional regulator [Paraglaciecola arctica]
MDIRFLVTFMEVAQTRHFGKAAENLYLTQSAVSARIKQLEEYFNSALFVRNRNSLQLTAAGEKLLPFASSLAATLEEARAAMNEESIQYLSIASTNNAWDMYLKQNLDEINEHLDHVSFRAEICSQEQLSRMLHEHSIDLALTTLPFKSDDVEILELSESSLSLYCSVAITEQPLEHLNIALDWGQKVNDSLEKTYPEIKKASMRTSSLQVALSYLSTNKSAIILPEKIAENLVNRGELRELESLTPLTVKCYLIYLKQPKDARLKTFIDVFKKMTEK